MSPDRDAIDRLDALPGPALAAALSAWRDAWLRPADLLTRTEHDALTASIGYPGRHLDEALRRAFIGWTPAALRARVAIGDRRRHYDGAWLLALLAGRVPALATSVVFRALPARCAVALKPGTAEPVFARLLAATIDRAAPDLAGTITCVAAGGQDPALERLVVAAPCCVAYGRDSTVERIVTLRGSRLTVAGGHRESVVVVLKDALGPDRIERLTRAVATDVAVYDQGGCLSPTALFVEDGGATTPAAFARSLFDALSAVSERLPPSAFGLEQAVANRLFLQECHHLARACGGLVLAPSRASVPAVCLLPGLPLRPVPGHRVLQVGSFGTLDHLAALLSPLNGRLQGVALAGDRIRLRAFLAANPGLRPPYVCRPGRLQLPPASWRENGVDLTRVLAGRF